MCYKEDMDLKLLRRGIVKVGGVAAVADQLKVSKAAVYMYLAGDRQPSDKLLELLNLELRLAKRKQL
jgi:predicted transcriptional regulator